MEKTGKTKKQLTCLDFKQKLKVIDDFKNGLRKNELVGKYNCNISTINRIISKENEIKNAAAKLNLSTKRQRFGLYHNLEEALFAWFQQQTGLNVVLDTHVLVEKAKECAVKLGVSTFEPTANWIWRWRKRFNVKPDRVHEETTDYPAKETVDSCIRSFCNSEAEGPQRKKKKISTHGKQQEKYADTCQQKSSAWGQRLSEMERNQQIFAEKIIDEVMYHGYRGLLNFDTGLTKLSRLSNSSRTSTPSRRSNSIINTGDSSFGSLSANYTLQPDSNTNNTSEEQRVSEVVTGSTDTFHFSEVVVKEEEAIEICDTGTSTKVETPPESVHDLQEGGELVCSRNVSEYKIEPGTEAAKQLAEKLKAETCYFKELAELVRAKRKNIEHK